MFVRIRRKYVECNKDRIKRAIINKKFVIVILLGCIMAVLAFVDTPDLRLQLTGISICIMMKWLL